MPLKCRIIIAFIVMISAENRAMKIAPERNMVKATSFSHSFYGSVENETWKRRSPLDAFPVINPHAYKPSLERKPAILKKTLSPRKRLRPFLTKLRSPIRGGSRVPVRNNLGPIIPKGLPDVIPVPLPFKVSPAMVVLPSVPKRRKRPRGKY